MTFPNLAPEIMEQMRQDHAEWEQKPAPCGIDHEDPYNPCTPERDDKGKLMCMTCGLRQERLDRSCRD